MTSLFAEADPRLVARLKESGWSPARRVNADEWIERYRQGGIQSFPLADSVLHALGGLEIVGDQRGQVAGTVESVVVGTSECSVATIRLWEEKTGLKLFPIGTVDHMGDLLIADNGGVFVAHSILSLVGESIEDALMTMCFGQKEWRTIARP